MGIYPYQSHALAASAGTIAVNTTVDEYGEGGDCSLREAIQAANTDAAFGGCAAGSGDDTIVLPPGTYTLTRTNSSYLAETPNDPGSHDLEISSNITINGADQATTIVDGNRLDRVLTIESGTVALNDLSITNGRAPDGADGVPDPNPGGYGGDGTAGNSGGGTGGDAGSGEAGGGQAGDGGDASTGAGIYVDAQRSAELAGTTIAGNFSLQNGGSGGSGDTNGAKCVGGAGGGVYVRAFGTFTFTHTILADNQASYSGPDCNGALDSLNYNLVETTAACTITGATGKNLLGQDPKLSPLGDNGGPTATHLPLPGSPLLERGGSACTQTNGNAMTADQRGSARPVDYDGSGTAQCDIGAVEVISHNSLALALDGDGSGTVLARDVGYQCQSGDADCTWPFDLGTTVTLSAQADAGSSFMAWDGDCSGAGSTCTLSMDAARTVTATYELLPTPTYTLSVALSGDGSGSVTSEPAGIDCGNGGSDCAQDYDENTPVTLTAAPAAGSTFAGWSGACSGTATTCQVTLAGDRAVTAGFSSGGSPDQSMYLPLLIR